MSQSVVSAIKEAEAHQPRSADLRLAVSVVSGHRERRDGGKAGDDHPVAPGRLPALLALEIPASRRPSSNSSRRPAAHPGHEHGQPAVGCTPYSWRVVEARHRDRADDGR